MSIMTLRCLLTLEILALAPQKDPGTGTLGEVEKDLWHQLHSWRVAGCHSVTSNFCDCEQNASFLFIRAFPHQTHICHARMPDAILHEMR